MAITYGQNKIQENYTVKLLLLSQDMVNIFHKGNGDFHQSNIPSYKYVLLFFKFLNYIIYKERPVFFGIY